jgi:catechol 2,3-dioxygenase-like lactoylglutathione lyase family enzyme
VKLSGHATVLLVDDVGGTTDYYREALGFETSLFELNPAHYGYASRDGCHLHFARFEGARSRPNHKEAPPDMFDAYFWVDDVDALHEELVGRGAELLHGPVNQEYGLREIRVRDPNGYVLAFGTSLD